MAETPAQSPSFIHVHLLQNACRLEAAWLFPFHRDRDKLTEGGDALQPCWAQRPAPTHTPHAPTPTREAGALERPRKPGPAAQTPPCSPSWRLGPLDPRGARLLGEGGPTLICSRTAWAQLLTGYFLPGPLPGLAHPLEPHMPHQPHLEALPSSPS